MLDTEDVVFIAGTYETGVDVSILITDAAWLEAVDVLEVLGVLTIVGVLDVVFVTAA